MRDLASQSREGDHLSQIAVTEAFKRVPTAWRQFRAVLRKNYVLQMRRSGRRRWLGLGSWGGLLLDIAVPALFFLVMCIPKRYVKPQHSPQQLSPLYDLDSPTWAFVYDGPASESGSARVLFAPNTTHVRALMLHLAQAAACPPDPTKARSSSDSYFRYFRPPGGVPPSCSASQEACIADERCYASVLEPGGQLEGREIATEAAAEAIRLPGTIDAVLDFSEWTAAAAAATAGPTKGAENGSGRSAVAGSAGSSGGGDAGRYSYGNGQYNYRYTLRLNHTSVPSTRLALEDFDVGPGAHYRRYYWAANLQTLLDAAILADVASKGGAPTPLLQPSFKPFPWPAYTLDLGATAAALFFNLLLVYAFLGPTRAAVAAAVQEKELGLREVLRLHGLQDAAYWGSWALSQWSVMAASGILCALVGIYPFRHSNPLLLLAFYWLVAAALLAFAYCLSTLFNTARVAGTAAGVIYAVAMMPGYLAPSLQPYGGGGWVAACLLPPSAISLLAHVLVKQESMQRGLTWVTLTQPVTVEYPFSAATVYMVLLLDVFLYMILLWYLDKVLPSTYGNALPWHFPLHAAYWRRPQPCKTPVAEGSRAESQSLLRSAVQGIDVPLTAHALHSSGGEVGAGGATDPLRQGGRGNGAPAAEFCRLTKVFPLAGGGSKVAVKGVTLGVPKGQVTALLGHNGAGKTTAISVLTGMLQPSSGETKIGGVNVQLDPAAARSALGVCPQFDLLWPSLSVAEHLQLVAAIKGYSDESCAEVARRAAAEVGLLDKLGSAAEDLSGGQRRKLSVAAAFVGDPVVVVLDEPTSGMDPHSKRFTWDVIRRRRHSAAVLLTTHSMQEADALADRIAIMAEGRLAAQGSPLDLKARFGVGYTLTVTLGRGTTAGDGHSTHSADPSSSKSHSAGSSSIAGRGNGQEGCSWLQRQQGELFELVRGHVPAAQALPQGQGPRDESSFLLPRESARRFPALLRALDDRSAQSSGGREDQSTLSVAGYGLSVTTLEEVFLRVTQEAAEEEAAANGLPANGSAAATEEAGGKDDSEFVVVSMPRHSYHSGPSLWRRQFAALFRKRALCALRDRPTSLAQIIVPVALVWLALWAGGTTAGLPQQPPLQLDRVHALAGHAAVMGAEGPVRRDQSGLLGAFAAAYPAAQLRDSGACSIVRLPYLQPLNGTLDGALLGSWFGPRRAYDALYIQSLPDLGCGRALLASSAGAGAGADAAAGSATLGLQLDPVGGGNGAKAAPAASPSAFRYAVLVNQTAVHALPAALNQAHSALLRLVTGDAGAGIAATLLPLPAVKGEYEVQVSELSGALLLVLCVAIASAGLSASFVVFLVGERRTRSRAAQAVAGALPSALWAANLGWDLLHCALPTLGMLCAFAAFDLPQFRGERLAAVGALLAVFPLGALPLTYALQLAFEDEMRALQRLNGLFFISGYLGFLVTWVLDTIVAFIPGSGRPAAINRLLKTALTAASPHYGLARGVFQVSQCYKGGEAGVLDEDPFTWHVTGKLVACMVGQGAVYMAVVLLVDGGALRRVEGRLLAAATAGLGIGGRGANELEASGGGATFEVGAAAAGAGQAEDEDVREERWAIQAGHASPASSAVLLDGVYRTYHQCTALPVHAVRGLWLSVPPGECFGLLGQNGAGKTTTFRMLTGEEAPNAGDAFVGGASVSKAPAAARRAAGYCPQHNCAPAQMTAREVLAMFAAVRGLPFSAARPVVDRLLRLLGLEDCADRPCGHYSGGQHRKLAVATALLGDCPVILMDEPSTGMDPGARHALWEVVRSELMGGGRSVVLTSHSMEECEAVCGRVGLLAAGRLRCVGSVARLKRRFAEGYRLELRCAAGTAAEARALVEGCARGARLHDADEGSGHLAFTLPRSGLDLPALIEALEGGTAGEGGPIEEWAVGEATLEQVFLGLARVGGQDGQQPH